MSTIVWPAACRSWNSLQDLQALVDGEVAGRLVGEDERGLRHERARERDPLLLAAGQLRRLVAQPMPESEPLELRGRRACRSRRGTPWYSRGVATLSTAVVPRQQVVALEDEADRPAADPRQRAVVEAPDVGAVELVPARALGRSRQPMMLIIVVLPEPDGPTMATISPRSTVIDTSRSASTWTWPMSYVRPMWSRLEQAHRKLPPPRIIAAARETPPPPPTVVAEFWVAARAGDDQLAGLQAGLDLGERARDEPDLDRRVETEPSAATTRTVYAPAAPDSARDGTDRTPVALAATIVMSADMPGRRPAGGASSVTLTANETTPFEPPAVADRVDRGDLAAERRIQGADRDRRRSARP